MFYFYRTIVWIAAPFLELLLAARARQGKELADRIGERKGRAGIKRPNGFLIWIHAASVGEAQSALILIDRLLTHNPTLHILMTTGTVTSAAMMAQRLPSQVIHQFYPLDHLRWVENFLNHWQPDLVLWMESELWPTMLHALHERDVPAVLVNARLSEKSYARWRIFEKLGAQVLQCFTAILAQTEGDKKRYLSLGAKNVTVTDNLKYSARALGYDESGLQKLSTHISGRPLWVFASTHEGEEEMAFRVHKTLRENFKNILTIIVPRHPVRGDNIHSLATIQDLKSGQRSQSILPEQTMDIYIADTLGELGLFYHLTPIAVIGRSFSADGGGGHNPIEAAQLKCAVLYGPNVQFQQQIYDEMKEAGAALQVMNENGLIDILTRLLSSPEFLKSQQERAYEFAAAKEQVIDRVWEAILPALERAV